MAQGKAGLRFGFVGAGEIAVASADAVADVPNASIVAILDVRTNLAEDLAARSGARVATSLDDMLTAEDVDAVYVCVPHHLHPEIAIKATAARKHVFVEKPMGVSPADAEAIADACRRARVACGVAFVAREAPAYRAARDVVASGAIGEVTGFRIGFIADKPASYWRSGWSGRVQDDWRTTWSKSGGGVLLMNAIHDLDAILWITQLVVDRVAAAIATIASPAEVEDTALALVTCAGGALGSIEALAAVPGAEGPSGRWVNRIYGSDGQILLPSPWDADQRYALYTRGSDRWSEVQPEGGRSPRARAFESFAAAVVAGDPPPVGADDGIRASRIVHAMYEAARRSTVRAVRGTENAGAADA
jgi:UDP-N-acetyl-2-amino-2-deoxyglucuronate dehydrogenase